MILLSVHLQALQQHYLLPYNGFRVLIVTKVSHSYMKPQ